jgi:hypothetical protein
VLRDGQVLSYDMSVTPNDLLVPVHCYDRLPSYYMFAGVVFVPLTQPYLHEYGEDWMNAAPRRLYDKAMHGMMKKPRQQIVIMSQVGRRSCRVGCGKENDKGDGARVAWGCRTVRPGVPSHCNRITVVLTKAAGSLCNGAGESQPAPRGSCVVH